MDSTKNVRSKFEAAVQTFTRNLARMMGIRKPHVKFLEPSVNQGDSKPRDKDKDKKGDGKGKGGGGGGKGSGFAGGAGTTTVEDDEDLDDDSTTASEDNSSDYQSRQAAEEEHHEIDDAAICEAVTKLKRYLRGMKLADGTRRHSTKEVQRKILKYEDDLYSGIKSLWDNDKDIEIALISIQMRKSMESAGCSKKAIDRMIKKFEEGKYQDDEDEKEIQIALASIEMRKDMKKAGHSKKTIDRRIKKFKADAYTK